MESVQTQAWLDQRRVDCLLTQRLEKEFADANLPTLTWFETLYLFEQAETPLRPKDLLGSVHVTKSGMTRLLGRQEEAKLIVRSICPSDKRGTFFELTSKGKDTVDSMKSIWKRVLEEHWQPRITDLRAQDMSSAYELIAASVLGRFEEEGACDLEGTGN